MVPVALEVKLRSKMFSFGLVGALAGAAKAPAMAETARRREDAETMMNVGLLFGEEVVLSE